MQVFEAHGIRFEHPDDWKVAQNLEDEEHITISVEASGTAFWMVSLMRDRPPADAIVDSVLDSFRSEYDDVDVYESDARICLLPTDAYDIDFVCLELINHARIRICETDDCSLLVLQQFSDQESSEIKLQLDALTDSLMWEMDDDPMADPFEFQNLFGAESEEESE